MFRIKQWRWRVSVGAAAIAALSMPIAAAQAWRPDKPVELVIPTAPGANNDRMIRIIQKIMQDQKLVSTPVVALNRPGGNQHLAFLYLVQKGTDPHALLLSNSTFFANELSGISPHHHSTLTPVSLLVIENNAFSVNASSPMKSMRDLMDRLAANPDAVSFAMPARGGVPHLTAAAAAKASGIDPKRLKLIVFKASGESITALAGGHVDVMVSSLASVMPHAKAGTLRVLGISGRERRGGAASHVPTLREQGIATDGVAAWRGLHGAKGLTAAQIGFWEEALGRAFEGAEWKAFLEENDLAPQYLRSREFARYLETEYAITKAVMADVGMGKQQ
jgi:putative tricarboxylic transport membrane protein